MSKPILILIIFAFIISVIAFLKQFSKRNTGVYPYEKQLTLFTPSERSFLMLLDISMGNRYRIMGKVRLGDLIKVAPGISPSKAQKAFNRISSKHVDFVACDSVSLSPSFVIELDDSSHKLLSRTQRDNFVNNALGAAGIPIFHFAANKQYTTVEILGILQNVFAAGKVR